MSKINAEISPFPWQSLPLYWKEKYLLYYFKKKKKKKFYFDLVHKDMCILVLNNEAFISAYNWL